MKNIIIISSISIFTLFGCATTNVSEPSSPLHSQVEAPLKANIKVGQKITGEAKATQILGLINLGPNRFADGIDYGTGGGFNLFDSFTYVKAAAAYNAVSSSDADIIISPTYVVETEDYFVFKTTTATVFGYKGSIDSITNK